MQRCTSRVCLLRSVFRPWTKIFTTTLNIWNTWQYTITTTFPFIANTALHGITHFTRRLTKAYFTNISTKGSIVYTPHSMAQNCWFGAIAQQIAQQANVRPWVEYWDSLEQRLCHYWVTYQRTLDINQISTTITCLCRKLVSCPPPTLLPNSLKSSLLSTPSPPHTTLRRLSNALDIDDPLTT